MKILLISIGTRGDMEPFIAVAELLRKHGHEVSCAFPEQFRNLAEDRQLSFASLGTKFMELLESDTGKAAMGGSGSGIRKYIAYIKLASKQTEANKELSQRQYKIIEETNWNRIVYNGKATYSILWELKHPGKTIFLSPLPYMHYVEGHSHIAFNSNYGSFFNRLTFSLAHFGTVTTLNIIRKWIGIKEKPNGKEIRKVLKEGKSVYTISPTLFPKPKNWINNLKVLGYHEPDKYTNWQPDEQLIAFLHKHEHMLMITFGSMLNPNPEHKTNILLDILQRNKIPAIINTASGGLVKPKIYDDELIYFVDTIPYDWILPKVYGVIHHGGSGTTHLACKYGCVSMIIPHIIDQFVWNKIIHRLGVGPKGMNINKMNTRTLEPKILELVNNKNFKKQAKKIQAAMAKESFDDELLSFIIE